MNRNHLNQLIESISEGASWQYYWPTDDRSPKINVGDTVDIIVDGETFKNVTLTDVTDEEVIFTGVTGEKHYFNWIFQKIQIVGGV